MIERVLSLNYHKDCGTSDILEISLSDECDADVMGEPGIQARSMAKRLYVGNLAYSVTTEVLQGLFEQYGVVRSAHVLIDRETGRSRGFGFVEMDGDNDALAAIESLDGNDHDGRRLTVNEALPRTPGGSDGGDFGGRGGGGGGGRGNYGGGGDFGGRGGGGGGRGNYGGGGRGGHGGGRGF